MIARSRFAPLGLGVVSILAVAAGCGVFSSDGDGPSDDPAAANKDAGSAEADAALQVLRVELDFPTFAPLDPRALAVTKGVVRVIDSSTPPVVVERAFATPAPLAFDLPGVRLSRPVKVVVELRGPDERLLGYGEQPRWDSQANPIIPVAVRRRIMYFTSGDRRSPGKNYDGQLRLLDMAPAQASEPGMVEPGGADLVSLQDPTGLFATADGTAIVQSGTIPGGGAKGQLNVYETRNHTLRSYPLPFVPAGMARVGTGAGSALCVPSKLGTAFALIDVATGAKTDISTSGIAGGGYVLHAIASSPDGTRAIAAVEHDNGATKVPYILLFDGKAITPYLLTDVPRGVRFTRDGKRIVLALDHPELGWGTTTLSVRPVETPDKVVTELRLEAGKTRPTGLFLHPVQPLAYVSHGYRSTVTPYDQLRTINFDTGAELYVSSEADIVKGAEFEPSSATALPYAPTVMIAGQWDSGNNQNGPFVLLASGRPTKLPLIATADFGSINDMAALFGDRL